MKKVILALATAAMLVSCKKDKTTQPTFKEDFIQLSNHKLAAYSITSSTRYLVVFESGLGDSHAIWQEKRTALDVSGKVDVVIYDRAGYGKSTSDTSARSLANLRKDLEAVVNKYANGRKVILVGHSWGGLIIREYAIQNPTKVAGLLFIDPSHEDYNIATQAIEDQLVAVFNSNGNQGAANESKQLVENLACAAQLPNLPNVPVTVLTSMKHDQANTAADEAYGKTRQDWFNAHETLKTGVTDFIHVGTTNAGHYIMTEEPVLVNNQLLALLAKLP